MCVCAYMDTYMCVNKPCGLGVLDLKKLTLLFDFAPLTQLPAWEAQTNLYLSQVGMLLRHNRDQDFVLSPQGTSFLVLICYPFIGEKTLKVQRKLCDNLSCQKSPLNLIS